MLLVKTLDWDSGDLARFLAVSQTSLLMLGNSFELCFSVPPVNVENNILSLSKNLFVMSIRSRIIRCVGQRPSFTMFCNGSSTINQLCYSTLWCHENLLKYHGVPCNISTGQHPRSMETSPRPPEAGHVQPADGMVP